jgi:hypothetical protein
VSSVFQRHFTALYQANELAVRLLHEEISSRAASVSTHLELSPTAVSATPVQLCHPLLAAVSTTEFQLASSIPHEYVRACTHAAHAYACSSTLHASTSGVEIHVAPASNVDFRHVDESVTAAVTSRSGKCVTMFHL